MIEVLSPGVYSSIQDEGRLGYRHLGVPISGFMDSYSAHYANALLGKDLNSALIEMAYAGAQFRFHESCSMVISGAKLKATLNNRLVEPLKVISVNKDEVLKIEVLEEGLWSYLAVSADIVSEEVMGSQSQYLGVTSSDKLYKGSCIPLKCIKVLKKAKSSIRFPSSGLTTDVLPVEKGPEFHLLPKSVRANLNELQFTMQSSSNRMAYNLEHDLIPHKFSMLTSPVLPGTVQWTPMGQLVCLMKDAQATGGYPRVLQLPETSYSMLAQKGGRGKTKFRFFCRNK